MICSRYDIWKQELLLYPKAVNQALFHIAKMNLDQLAPGEYAINGDLVYASVKETHTKHWTLQKPEVHRTYTDIHYLIEGTEVIRFAPVSAPAVVAEEHFATRDCALYEQVEDESEVLLGPGSFAVFFPGDIHRPCCSLEKDLPIRKVVVKIHKSLLGY